MFRRTLLAILFLLFSVVSSAAAGAQERVLVWLEGEPLAELHARSLPPLPGLYRPLRLDDAQLTAPREALRASRAQVRERLERLGFIADGEADIVLHALIGRMPEENIEVAASVPGIRMIRAVRSYRPLLDGAVPLVKADAIWASLGGEERAGRGLKIAILDTGIDIANPMLNDPRLEVPAGFPKGEREFTNSKVIVARNYLGMLGDPRDTPSAMDREGHGTFLAGIAAGRRAVAPLAELAGVAPAAQLGNYRLFGSPLSFSDTTDAVVIAAINDAVADGMDVLNLSLGGFTLDLPSEEPVSQAVAAAVHAGKVVVVAAGNEGPWVATVTEPGTSPAAITVGASNNARVLGYPLRLTAPEAVPQQVQRVGAVPSTTTRLTAAIGPAPIWKPASNGCVAVAAPDDVKGKIALVEDDDNCSRSTKLKNLTDGEALAAIIYRGDDSDARAMSFSPPPTIPVLQISRTDGEAITAVPSLNGSGQAAIDPTIGSFAVQADRMASFSSRGPSNDMELKPDLVAPGTSIYSAFQINDSLGVFYSLGQFGMSDGTSFSAPIVAGAAALMKQAHPSWTPAQIKSALVNTAAVVATEGAQAASILAAGAGRLDASRAVAATAAFDPVGLSFSSRLLKEQTVVRRTLKITNTGASAQTFNIEVRPRVESAGASVSVSPAGANVGPGETASIEASFQTPATVSGTAFIDGRLLIKSSSGAEYNVPYWAQVIDSTRIDWLLRIRGNGQTERISTMLPRALAVQAVDRDFVAIAGVPIKFEIASGGGTLSASDVTTDFSGVAAVTLRLPDVPGPVEVKASASDQISRTFTVTARPSPAFPQAGVVHAASYVPALAPGAIFAIFGTGLAAGQASATALPLPRTLASAQVLFNGSPAPLFYVSPAQINAQVPFEVAGSPTAELSVSVLGVSSPPVTIAISAAAPGIFTVNQDGRGAAVLQHADYSAVTPSNPAHAGEILLLYLSGLGAVQPPVASGAAAPIPPANTVVTPSVRVGSVNARVLFSGLVPSLAGLYQVNFEVPAGVTPGDAVQLSLTIDSATSNVVALPVK